MDRKKWLVNGLDKEKAQGLEIGPFFNPIVPRSEGWKTFIVDFTDTVSLRKIGFEHSNETIRQMSSQIEDVDFIWTEGKKLENVVIPGLHGRLDYLISSHNIEHLPDLLGFLQSADLLLRPEGIISMAVPDLRYTFDFFFNPSTIGQILRSHSEKKTRHPAETIFDCRTRSARMNNTSAWQPDTGHDVSCHTGNFEEYYKIYVKESTQPPADYIDCHAWYFTPSSFRLLILELHQLQLIPFVVQDMLLPDKTRASEFLVKLRKDTTKLSMEQFDKERINLLRETIRELAERVDQL